MTSSTWDEVGLCRSTAISQKLSSLGSCQCCFFPIRRILGRLLHRFFSGKKKLHMFFFVMIGDQSLFLGWVESRASHDQPASGKLTNRHGKAPSFLVNTIKMLHFWWRFVSLPFSLGESSDSFQAFAKAKMNGDQGVETQAVWGWRRRD